MRTNRRFARGSDTFRRLTHLAMGLSLGAFASVAQASPAGAVQGAIATVVGLDPQLPGEPLTGSVCSGAQWRCDAHVLATHDGHIRPFATPQGYGPADLQSAYKIPTTPVSGTPTVAIIDAYGYSSLESDLATYRSTYGLPACTTANGCLKIVNQTGQTTPLPPDPPANDDWTVETALDIDMVSAACPACKILVIQAQDDQSDGLFTANNVPATAGATVVSNSWGGPEQAGQPATAYETYFNHPGIAVFVSAGDDGYNDAGQGPDYPATSAYVIAVGGTNLQKATNSRGWTETAWTSGGSACSLSIPKPAYQTGTMCQYKATTDIAAVGDPATGVAVYNTMNGNGGWIVVGGTSASSPLVASIFAATGNGGQTSGSFVMQNASKLYDVTSGSNGSCGNILCNAGTGWDGPTGYGTPNAQALVSGAGTGGGSGSGTGGGDGNGGGSGSGTGTGNGDGNGGGDVGVGGTAPTGNDVVGGCAAGGSGAGFALVFVVGLLAAGRRRED